MCSPWQFPSSCHDSRIFSRLALYVLTFTLANKYIKRKFSANSNGSFSRRPAGDLLLLGSFTPFFPQYVPYDSAVGCCFQETFYFPDQSSTCPSHTGGDEATGVQGIWEMRQSCQLVVILNELAQRSSQSK